jgi:hypothetical protein
MDTTERESLTSSGSFNNKDIVLEPAWKTMQRSSTETVKHVKYEIATHKYTKEELLSVWKPRLKLPSESAAHSLVASEECLCPVNLLPPEQLQQEEVLSPSLFSFSLPFSLLWCISFVY